MHPSRKLMVVFLVIFFEESSSACVDNFALNSVDVLVHKQKNTRAAIHRGENFNILDSYESIDVISSNASQICEGMVKNFPVLETLSFINAGLTIVEPGAFQNVPSLKYLSLSVNKLTNIARGVFDPIKSLKVLYLTRNEIGTIEDGAFAEMKNLKALYLNHNKLRELSGNILFGSPKISLVDFSYNELTRIQKNAFDDLRPGSTVKTIKILLTNNKIGIVDSEALKPLIPVNLHLESNEIVHTSDIVFPLKESSYVCLNNNKIQCVADDVKEFLEVTNIKVDIKKNPIECACVERLNELKGYSRGEINVDTTLPCQTESLFFGNQL